MTRLVLLLVGVAAIAALPLQDAPSSQADLLTKLLMVNPDENDIDVDPLSSPKTDNSLSPKNDISPSPKTDISPSPSPASPPPSAIPDTSPEPQKLDPTPVDAEATPTEDQVEGTEEKAEIDVKTQPDEETVPELPVQDGEQVLPQADLEERRVVIIDPAFVEPELDQEQPNDYEFFIMQGNSEVMQPDPSLKYFIDEEEKQVSYESEEVIPDYIEPLVPGIDQIRELSESEEVPEYSVVNLPFEPNFEEEEEEDDFSVEQEMEPSPEYYEEPGVDPGFIVVEEEDPMNSSEMDDQNYEEADEEEYEEPLEPQEEPSGLFSWGIPGFINEEVNSEESEQNEEPPFVEDPVDYEMAPENERIIPDIAALNDPDYDVVVIGEDGPNSEEFRGPDYVEEPIELPMNEEDVSFETDGEDELPSEFNYGMHHDYEEIPEYDGYFNPDENNNIPYYEMPEESFSFKDKPIVAEFHPIMFPESFFDSEDDMNPGDEPLMQDNEYSDDDDEPVSGETPGYSISIYSKPRPISDFDGPEPDPVPLKDILFPFMNADHVDNDDEGMMMENNDASQEQFDDSQMSLLPIVGETMMPEQRPLPIAEYPDVHHHDMSPELHWTPDHNTHEDRPAFFPMNNEPKNTPVFFNRWNDNVPYSSFRGHHDWNHHRQNNFRMGGFNSHPVAPFRSTNSPAPQMINDFGPRYPDSYDFHYSNGPMAPPRPFYEPFNSRQNYNPFNDYSQQSYIIPLGPNRRHSDYNVFRSPNGPQYRPEQDIYRSGPPNPSVSSYYGDLDNMNNPHSSPFNTFHKRQQQSDIDVQPIEMTIYADPDSSFSSRNEQFPFFLLKHIDRILSARNNQPASARSPQGYTGSTLYPNVPSPHDRYAPEYF